MVGVTRAALSALATLCLLEVPLLGPGARAATPDLDEYGDQLLTTTVGANKAPREGAIRVLVVPVDLAGEGRDFSQILPFFDPDPAAGYTFSNYWRAQSGGRLDVDTYVASAVVFDACPIASPGCRLGADNIGDAVEVGRLVFERVLAELPVPLSHFDLGGEGGAPDGWVDGVVLLMPGYGGGVAPPVWPFLEVVADGVQVGHASISRLDRETILHEFGHNLGACDQYLWSFEHSLMSLCDDCSLDVHTRYKLGWAEVIEVAAGEEIVANLAASVGDGPVLRIGDDREYFLVEYRAPHALGDKTVDGGLDGVLVVHVDETVSSPLLAQSDYPDNHALLETERPTGAPQQTWFGAGDALEPAATHGETTESQAYLDTNWYSGARTGIRIAVEDRGVDDLGRVVYRVRARGALPEGQSPRVTDLTAEEAPLTPAPEPAVTGGAEGDGGCAGGQGGGALGALGLLGLLALARRRRGAIAALAAALTLGGACGDAPAGSAADAEADTWDAEAGADAEDAVDSSALDASTAPDTAIPWPQPRPSCVRFAPNAADPTEALFDPGCVIDVHVSMDVGDWEALRRETRSVVDVVGGADCLDGPPADVFSWYEADVTVGGVRVTRAGIRKKGFMGSLDVVKPSLKVRFDKLEDGQTLSGAQRMTLNNMKQDEGLINTCLAYGLMADMGIAAPRCNFARVWVNGEDLGVYAHVESIKAPFLRRRFGDDGGNLYEATISDFSDLYRNTWQKKNHEEADDWSDLDAVVAALDVPDDGLVESLEAVIDLDAFFTFWAAEVLVAHWDGYAGNLNNTYIYGDPADGGRFRFIPWGADAVFGPTPVELFGERELPVGVYAFGRIANRLYGYPPTQATYASRVNELIAYHWNVDALVAEIDRMEALILPDVAPWLRAEVSLNIAGKRAFVRDQPGAVLDELVPYPEPWTSGTPESICWLEIGHISGEFDTAWEVTGGWQWMGEGSGRVELELNGQPYNVGNVRANARVATLEGFEGDGLIEIVGLGEDGAWVVVWITAPLQDITADSTHPLDWQVYRGWFGRNRTFGADDIEILALLGDGEVALEEAGTFPNDRVTGTFSATLFEQ